MYLGTPNNAISCQKGNKTAIGNFGSIYARAPCFVPIDFFCSVNMCRKTKLTPIMVSSAKMGVKPLFCIFGSSYARAPVFGHIEFFCIVNV